jgi:hypothetical protein
MITDEQVQALPTDAPVRRDRLWRILWWVEDHPEMHDQAEWMYVGECGTTYCFGGWGLVFAGWAPRGVGGALTRDSDGDEVPSYYQAAEVFGFRPGGDYFSGIPDMLFYQCDTLADLRRVIERIAGLEPERAGMELTGFSQDDAGYSECCPAGPLSGF